jgi:hypothetical protein
VRCGWPLPDQRRLHRVPGIILGYYFGLHSVNRAGQILVIVAVVLSVISIVISGVSGGPQ